MPNCNRPLLVKFTNWAPYSADGEALLALWAVRWGNRLEKIL